MERVNSSVLSPALTSVLEDLKDRFNVKISPVIDLQFLVEWLDFLLQVVFAGSVHELLL